MINSWALTGRQHNVIRKKRWRIEIPFHMLFLYFVNICFLQKCVKHLIIIARRFFIRCSYILRIRRKNGVTNANNGDPFLTSFCRTGACENVAKAPRDFSNFGGNLCGKRIYTATVTDGWNGIFVSW